jgi:molecular chaperone DnaK
MVQEAESHAEEDKARREAIELRNLSESMVYQAERTLSDYGDKIDSALKLNLEEKIAAVKDILENDPENLERLRPAYQELTNTLSQAGASMYEEAGAAPAPDGEEAEEPVEEAADDEATVEGEYREVNN